MVARDPLAGSASSLNVCVIGDGGGAHVRSRVDALASCVDGVHLLTPRASDLTTVTETVVENSEAATFETFRRWRDVISSCAGDVVHIQYASSWGAWVFALMNDPRPMVLTVMGGDVLFNEQSKPHPLARWLTRCVLDRANVITAKTDHLASSMVALGVDEQKIARLVWGIDTDIFSPGDKATARSSIGVDADALVVFSPRMLNPFYNIDVMIRAVAKVRAIFPNVQLLLSEYEAQAGYRQELESLAKDLGVADVVTFVGSLTPDEMATYYRASDVAVGLPPSDGFPQTVFEAMSCGTVNVVTPLDRYAEFIDDGETAIYAAPDPDTLSEKLMMLFSDPGMRAQIADAGIQKMTEIPNLNDSAREIANVMGDARARSVGQPLNPLRRWMGWLILLGLSMRPQMTLSARPIDAAKE